MRPNSNMFRYLFLPRHKCDSYTEIGRKPRNFRPYPEWQTKRPTAPTANMARVSFSVFASVVLYFVSSCVFVFLYLNVFCLLFVLLVSVWLARAFCRVTDPPTHQVPCTPVGSPFGHRDWSNSQMMNRTHA